MQELLARLNAITDEAWARPLIILGGSIVVAFFVEKVVTRLLALAAARTKSNLDDKIIAALERPIFFSVVLFGLYLTTVELDIGATPTFFTLGLLKTLAVLMWSAATFRVSHELLEAFSIHAENRGLVQARTIPIFEIVIKAAILGGAVYCLFLAWDIDLTAWLASAGIIGIAVGFAAKDTLANLFSGLFIIADAPYKVGDFIVLDGDIQGRPLRGEVTHIGMRSTRMTTRDDLEITIPNAVMGNSKIINETGGASTRQRARVRVGVAYGSDVERVAEVLSQCPVGVPHVLDDPPAEVRFREFGDSSLDFDLLFWIDRSEGRGTTESLVNFRIYRALADNHIEIPFPQRDLHIKAMPSHDLSP